MAQIHSGTVPASARALEFDVAVADDGTATSGLGGSPIPTEEEWQAEHFVLAGLVRCTLASLDYHLRQGGLRASASGSAHGVVTRREDGLYAFVELHAAFAVDLEQPLGRGAVQELVAKAERGCFVGNSLTARPRYRWTVDGEELR
jgi:organic hydroperoxide reductase OsmC/OhrA